MPWAVGTYLRKDELFPTLTSHSNDIAFNPQGTVFSGCWTCVEGGANQAWVPLSLNFS